MDLTIHLNLRIGWGCRSSARRRHGGRALLARWRGWRCHMQARLRPSDGPGRFSNATTHHGRAQRVQRRKIPTHVIYSQSRTHVGSRPTALSPRPSMLSDAAQASLPDCRRPEPWPRHLDTKPRHQLDTSTPHANSTPLDTPRHHLGWYHARRCQGAKLDTSTPLDTPRHRSTPLDTPLDTARHL